MKKSQILAAAAIATPALLAGIWLGGLGPKKIIQVPVVKTISSPELTQRVADLELERDGLKAKLAGIAPRPPKIIYRDSVVYVTLPPSEVASHLAVSSSGQGSVEAYTRVNSGWTRALAQGVDLRDCDQGFTWGPEGFTCNRAVLGHLSMGLAAGYEYRAGLVAKAGLSWRPSYRSPWRVDLLATTRETIEVSVWRGWPR